jgi:hypothetical protein
VIADILIGEANGLEALAQKHGVASPVVLPAGLVRPPVHLDDEARADADESEKVAAKRGLPAKGEAARNRRS